MCKALSRPTVEIKWFRCKCADNVVASSTSLTVRRRRNATRTQRLRSLASRCRRRIMLTGTPLQNDLAELQNLLSFLLPRLFTDDVAGRLGDGKVLAPTAAWAESHAADFTVPASQGCYILRALLEADVSLLRMCRSRMCSFSALRHCRSTTPVVAAPHSCFQLHCVWQRPWSMSSSPV